MGEAKLKEMEELRTHCQEQEMLLGQASQDDTRAKAKAAQMQKALEEAHIRNEALEARMHQMRADQEAADKEWRAFDLAREQQNHQKGKKGKKGRKSADKKTRVDLSRANSFRSDVPD